MLRRGQSSRRGTDWEIKALLWCFLPQTLVLENKIAKMTGDRTASAESHWAQVSSLGPLESYWWQPLHDIFWGVDWVSTRNQSCQVTSHYSPNGIYYHDLLFFCLPSIILQTIHPVEIQVSCSMTGIWQVTRMIQQHESQDILLPQASASLHSIIFCPPWYWGGI